MWKWGWSEMNWCDNWEKRYKTGRETFRLQRSRSLLRAQEREGEGSLLFSIINSWMPLFLFPARLIFFCSYSIANGLWVCSHARLRCLKYSLIMGFVHLITTALLFFFSDSFGTKSTLVAEFREMLFKATLGCCKGRDWTVPPPCREAKC